MRCSLQTKESNRCHNKTLSFTSSCWDWEKSLVHDQWEYLAVGYWVSDLGPSGVCPSKHDIGRTSHAPYHQLAAINGEKKYTDNDKSNSWSISNLMQLDLLQPYIGGRPPDLFLGLLLESIPVFLLGKKNQWFYSFHQYLHFHAV